MDKRILNLLESADAAQREKGIKALAALGTPEALEQLAITYQAEPDPRLKKLAVKAGQYIKKKQREEYYGDLDDIEEDDYIIEEAPERDTQTRKQVVVEVSRETNMASQRAMNKAIELLEGGRKKKTMREARMHVERAFEMNPNLQNDAFYLGIAADVLEVEAHEVAPLLLGSNSDLDEAVLDSSKTRVKVKRSKPKAGHGHDEQATWTTAIIDLFIYWAVTSAAFVAITVILFSSIGDLFSDIYAQMVAAGEITVDSESGNFITEVLYLALTPDNIGEEVLYTFSAVATNALWTLLYLWMINIIAGAWVGGDGTLRELIHKAYIFMIGMDIAMYVWVAVLFYIMFAALGDANKAMVLYPGTPPNIILGNFQAAIDDVAPTLALAFMAGLMIYIVGWSAIIGKAYRFGGGKGCQTIFLFVCVLIFCNCFFTIIAGLLANAGY